MEWTYSKNALNTFVENMTSEEDDDAWGDLFLVNGQFRTAVTHNRLLIEKIAPILYRRFHSEIWDLCRAAAKHGRGQGAWFLTRLPLFKNVHDNDSFQQFMVRNALAQGARELLDREEQSHEADISKISPATTTELGVESPEARTARARSYYLSKNFRKAARAEKAIAEAKKYYDVDLEVVETGTGRYELRLKAQASSPTTADSEK
jgi:hypothetical protein